MVSLKRVTEKQKELYRKKLYPTSLSQKTVCQGSSHSAYRLVFRVLNNNEVQGFRHQSIRCFEDQNTWLIK